MKYLFWTCFATFVFSDCQPQDLVPFRVDTLWGYRNKQNLVKIEPQFQYASKFRYGVAIVAKNESLGAIDSNNKLLIPFQYEYLKPLDSSEFVFGYRAKYLGEHIIGVIGRDEKVKIPATYSYISKYNGIYTVEKKKDSIWGKTPIGDLRSVRVFEGLLDSNGNVLIPCIYDNVSWMNDSLFDVTRGGSGTSHALFNRKGEQLTGFEYMVFGKFIDGIAKARIGDKFGFIYPTGKVAIPVQFDYCEEFHNDCAIIKQQNKWGAINKKGKVIIEPKLDYEQVKIILNEKLHQADKAL